GSTDERARASAGEGRRRLWMFRCQPSAQLADRACRRSVELDCRRDRLRETAVEDDVQRSSHWFSLAIAAGEVISLDLIVWPMGGLGSQIARQRPARALTRAGLSSVVPNY